MQTPYFSSDLDPAQGLCDTKLSANAPSTTQAPLTAQSLYEQLVMQRSCGEHEYFQVVMSGKPQGAKFVKKLWAMLEEPSIRSIIRWDPSGTKVIITDRGEFCETVLRTFFGHNKFANFARQLSYFNFRRQRSLDVSVTCFGHPDFTAHDYDRTLQICSSYKKNSSSNKNNSKPRRQRSPNVNCGEDANLKRSRGAEYECGDTRHAANIPATKQQRLDCAYGMQQNVANVPATVSGFAFNNQQHYQAEAVLAGQTSNSPRSANNGVVPNSLVSAVDHWLSSAQPAMQAHMQCSHEDLKLAMHAHMQCSHPKASLTALPPAPPLFSHCPSSLASDAFFEPNRHKGLADIYEKKLVLQDLLAVPTGSLAMPTGMYLQPPIHLPADRLGLPSVGVIQSSAHAQLQPNSIPPPPQSVLQLLALAQQEDLAMRNLPSLSSVLRIALPDLASII
jgi:hypothetical protein